MPETNTDTNELRSELSASKEFALNGQWSLGCERLEEGLALTLRHPERAPFELEISLTEAGPVLRVKSVAALELETSRAIHARCQSFNLEASEQITMAAPAVELKAGARLSLEGGHLEAAATRGDLRMRANDDVQLLGERVLLNCERELPLPRWLAQTAQHEQLVPRADVIGDLALPCAPTDASSDPV